MIDLYGHVRLEIALARANLLQLDSGSSGLDVGVLGQDAQTSDVFVLNQSALDVQHLGLPGDDTNIQWVDLLGDARSVTLTRGSKLNNGVLPQLDVGILTATIVGPSFNPFANDFIRPGKAVRLVYEDGTVLFTGKLDSAVPTFAKPPHTTTVTLTAVDRVQQLQSITKAGAVAQTFDQRIDAILTGPGIPYSTFDGAVNVADTDFSGTLLAHLQLAVDSDHARMYIGRDNQVYVYGQDYAFPASGLTLTDQDSNPGYVSMTGITGAQGVFNDITIKNLTMSAGAGVETDYNYSDSTSISTWGDNHTDVSTNLASTTDIDSLGALLLSKYKDPKNAIRTVTFNAKDVQDQAAGLELCTTVHIHYEDNWFTLDSDYQILSIQHDLTPDRWLVTLDVIPL